MDCPPGTLFDTNQNICNYPHKCLCFNGQSGQQSLLTGYKDESQSTQRETQGHGVIQTFYSRGESTGGSEGSLQGFRENQHSHYTNNAQGISGIQNINSNLNFGESSR